MTCVMLRGKGETMIQPTPDDVGRPVTYRAFAGSEPELGTIYSVKPDGRCFVVYKPGGTPQLTPTENLTFTIVDKTAEARLIDEILGDDS